MPTPLFLLLHLLHFKPALCFCVPLLPADLNLTEGDRLQVFLSHAEGTVDVTVGMEGQGPIYRGRGQQNAEFVLEIAETGNYHISVTGHQAKGSISFTRIPGEMK